MVWRQGPTSFFGLWKSIYFQHCWKTPFHIEWSWRPHQKSFDHIWEGLFLGHWMFSQIKCYWIHGHAISFENPALEEPKVLTTWPLTEKVCQPLLTGSVKAAEVETWEGLPGRSGGLRLPTSIKAGEGSLSVCRTKIPQAAWWGQMWKKKEEALAQVIVQTLKLGTLLLRGSSGFQLRVRPIAHNVSPFSLTHLPLSSLWFKFSSLSYHLGTWLNAPSSRKPSLNALGWMKCFLLSHSQRVLIYSLSHRTHCSPGL